MNCKTANNLDLVGVISKFGYAPKYFRGTDAWCTSPLRNEQVPSLKICTVKNVWFDHGEGKGGTVIDFVKALKNYSTKEALTYLSDTSFSFHQPKVLREDISKEETSVGFEIIKKQNLKNIALIDYLKSRSISLQVARIFCFELYYRNKGKNYFAIAFQNDSGGMELRNKYFKGCMGPKGIRTINNGSKNVNLFEGFIDYLSFLTLMPSKVNENFIITNSTSLIKKVHSKLNDYDMIKTFFDNDESGINATQVIQENCKHKFSNESEKFKKFKDFNDYLMNYKK